jgi:hypothetical protein
MAYSKTTWVNGSEPALSATNLNKLETQYETAETDFAPIVGTASVATTSWTTVSISGFEFRAVATTSPSSETYVPIVNFALASYEAAVEAGISFVESTASGIVLYATSEPTVTINFDYTYIKG